MVYSPVFLTPPPVIDFNDEVLLTFPQPHILLLTLNRPGAFPTHPSPSPLTPTRQPSSTRSSRTSQRSSLVTWTGSSSSRRSGV